MSLTSSFSSFACGPWSQGGFGHGAGSWLGGFHFPFGLLTLALLAGGAFWLISRNRTPVPQESARPLDILKRRYAAGEISREDFQRQRSDLND